MSGVASAWDQARCEWWDLMGQHLSGRQNFWHACHNARQANPDHSPSGTGGSAGWLFLFLVLNDLLSLNDLGLVLTTQLLAEVLAHLLVADRVDELATSRRDPASDWHATIGTLLSRWLLLCLGIFVVSWTSWTSLLWFPRWHCLFCLFSAFALH